MPLPARPVWLFDLDNTLHHADAGIFDLINRAMSAYLADKLNLDLAAASALRQDYWHRYGATLAGLRRHHPHINLADFLRASHPLAELLPALRPVAGMRAILSTLPGRKAVFSNGPGFYVRALVAAMDIGDCFDALFGTDDVGFHYKPATAAYRRVCAALGADAGACVMVDDSADNLHTAKALGMHTVWFGPQARPLPFIDAAVADMAALGRWALEAARQRTQTAVVAARLSD